jgi:quercetin dioxygenase-like cupin family protein
MKKTLKSKEATHYTPKSMLEYQTGGIASRTLIENENCTVTLFACDAGTCVSEHSAPFDALVHVIEGTGKFTVGGIEQKVESGELLLMPSDIPHSVHAPVRFRMILIMARTNKH